MADNKEALIDTSLLVNGAETIGSSYDKKHHEILYSCGMDCRMYQGEKIRGAIKTLPVDFIVTEIDSDGELVTLDKNCPILDPPDTKLSPQNDGIISYDIIDISDVLNKRKMSELRDLSRRFEDHVDTNTSSVFHEVVELGCYSSRNCHLLRHLFRTSFPLLQISNTYNDKNIGQLVAVPIPKRSYSKLSTLLGKEDTTKLLDFIKTAHPLANKFVCLSQKKHHKEIHDLILKLFGTFLQSKTVYTITKRKPEKNEQKDIGTLSRSSRSVSSSNSKSDSSSLDTFVTSTSDFFSGGPDLFSSPVLSSSSSDDDNIFKGPHDISSPTIAVSFKPLTARKAKEVLPKPFYHTRFTLKKNNVETLEAITKVSKLLDINPGRIMLSGNKDKRAVTYQRVSIDNVSMESLSSISVPGIELGSFEYTPRQIEIGSHCGNHFKIRVRELTKTSLESESSLDDIIRTWMNSLVEKGFVNYYGMQRFGHCHHEDGFLLAPVIGHLMLQDEPEAAVRVYCDSVSFMGNTSPELRGGKEVGSFKRTGPVVPRKSSKYLMLHSNLEKYGMDRYGCEKTLLSLPSLARSFYVSSFNSLLWNHLASFRIREYGYEPVEGDLVRGNTDNGDEVRVITSSDIRSNRYTMKDIVLPMVGHKSVLPTNRVGDKLTKLLASFGLSILSFCGCRYSLGMRGSYRKLVSFPRGLKWRIRSPEASPAAPVASSAAAAAAGNGGVAVPITPTSTQKPCLEMIFRLDNGSYVTTMLNEILHFKH